MGRNERGNPKNSVDSNESTFSRINSNSRRISKYNNEKINIEKKKFIAKKNLVKLPTKIFKKPNVKWRRNFLLINEQALNESITWKEGVMIKYLLVCFPSSNKFNKREFDS